MYNARAYNPKCELDSIDRSMQSSGLNLTSASGRHWAPSLPTCPGGTHSQTHTLQVRSGDLLDHRPSAIPTNLPASHSSRLQSPRQQSLKNHPSMTSTPHHQRIQECLA
jgi:hypothetical protein